MPKAEAEKFPVTLVRGGGIVHVLRESSSSSSSSWTAMNGGGGGGMRNDDGDMRNDDGDECMVGRCDDDVCVIGDGVVMLVVCCSYLE